VTQGGLLALAGMMLALAGLLIPSLRSTTRHVVHQTNAPANNIALDLALCASILYASVSAIFDVSVSRPPMIALIAVIAGLMRHNCSTIFLIRLPRWSSYLALILAGLMLICTIFRFIAAGIFFTDISLKNLFLAEKWFPMPLEAGFLLEGDNLIVRYKRELSGTTEELSRYIVHTIVSLPYDVPLLKNAAKLAVNNGQLEEAKSFVRRGLEISPRDADLLGLERQLHQPNSVS
jgi:hypothetical protein